MQNYATGNTGSLSLVNPHQFHGSVGPAEPEKLGSRVLELSSVLQTTLDISEQLTIFHKHIMRYVALDGIDFKEPADANSLKIGETATHRATYDLTLQSIQLGAIRFYRELPFGDQELQTLENLLCALVYPLRNALQYNAALKLASHDPLTGVANRLAFNEALRREVDLAHRQNTPLSVLVIDADHFKQVNDTYGHAFGDDVLKAIANSAAATVRRSDLLYRYGGEEFVVIASHTNEHGAQLLAERIRSAVDSITSIRGRDMSISISVGTSTLRATEQGDALFERADAAMYQAKRHGRNQVVQA